MTKSIPDSVVQCSANLKHCWLVSTVRFVKSPARSTSSVNYNYELARFMYKLAW